MPVGEGGKRVTTDMGRDFLFIKAVKDTDVFINKSGLKTRDFMEAARFLAGMGAGNQSPKRAAFFMDSRGLCGRNSHILRPSF